MKLEDPEVQKKLEYLRELMDDREVLRVQIPDAASTMEGFIVDFLENGYLPRVGDYGVAADLALVCGTVNGICLLLDISTEELLAAVRRGGFSEPPSDIARTIPT